MILCFSPSPDNKKIYTFASFTPGGVNRAQEVIPWLSGKGINAARALASMHERVLFVGLMGNDLRAAAPDILREAHIEPRLVFTRAHTRTCITVIDRANGSATELIEETPPIDQVDAAALIGLFREILDKEPIEAVVASGSLPNGCPVDLYRRAGEICTEVNVPLILDAAGTPLLEALDAKPAVVKINADELRDAQPLEDGEALPDAVRKISATTGGLAVITAGPGSVMYSRNGSPCESVRPPTIDPVNPIGSGDAVAGGIAIGVSRKYSDDQSVRLGIAMGTVNALTLRPGDFPREDAERLEALIR